MRHARKHPSAILIAGPTASGKSALALRLAGDRNGVIVNADSMQVYGGLTVLTARPDGADLARAPHRLYGFVAATDAYSVGRWLADVAEVVADAGAAGRTPIVVGGTGLYFLALLEGLSPVPEIPADIRAHWRGVALDVGAADLHAHLASKDPEMAARLSPSDAQRVTRALEVLDATGRSLADWQRQPGVPVLAAEDCERLVVSPPRDVLHARANQRFDAMMNGGALDEVRALAALGLSSELPVMRALGVRPLIDLLDGRLSEPEAVEQAKAETRQYQKRQLTWLRRQMSAWKLVET
jgi:tRNA dimethylallyltransferase